MYQNERDVAKKAKSKVGGGKYFSQRSQCEQALVKANENSGKKAVYVLENGRCRITYTKRRTRYDNTSRFETQQACSAKAGEYSQQLADQGYQLDSPVDASGRSLSNIAGDGAGGGAIDNALGAAPDASALAGAVPGAEGASVADASTTNLESKLAQQKTELDAAISPEQRACEAEGKSWDPTARRGKGKCRKNAKKTAKK